MAIYAIWNNKGGVGKSYLTFQLASEYARQNPHKKVLVVDICPQANSSSMLLGGMDQGEARLTQIHTQHPRRTISGYIEERIRSPYMSPNSGTSYITQVLRYNTSVSAFRTVVNEIGKEIWGVWGTTPQFFCIHPSGASTPISQKAFKEMFQYEVNDANTASVVSGALGIPIASLTAGQKNVAGRNIPINQSQLDKQVPNIRELVQKIE